MKGSILLGLLLVSSAASAAEPVFEPVLRENFPDAFVMPEGNGSFIAYATNDGQNVPMAVSSDLVNWTPVKDSSGKRADAMPTLAPWVKQGFTWAPEVMKVGANYLLYYTANHRKEDKQCVGVAVSQSPRGPFVDNSAEPMVCQFDLGGSIDANPFRDAGGKLYLYWKADGNRIGKRSRLWGAELTPDGMKLAGAPKDIGLTDEDEWEQKVIEAPTMIRVPEGYAMIYSGGYYGWNPDQRLSPYAMNWARCEGPLGPCRDAGPKPILYSYSDPGKAGCLSGPGHQSIFRANGGTFISFHGWATTRGCRKSDNKRFLYVAPFGWENGAPAIAPSLRVEKGMAERG
ncbi:glycoside hydrolase family 43 protein [Sphingomonas sp. LHG3406-1]|uniref:glycoside hydrolase family 43 protein n=1 Tax=Sphingomonas sp. LHG3406-1 TaxID=2804617 RepID=UPI0026356C9E|nr:glycoside hydrolase family 43 protein [Sphingomonas sp. LHG3406-1]